MNEHAYHIKTDIFEGPLDLLLSLIEKRKLHISDVSLAKVADDFVQYINTHKEYPLAKTAHFLLIASTLILLKSKALLPTLELTLEEEESIEELERRVSLYKIFKSCGESLQQQFGAHRLFFREYKTQDKPLFSPPKDFSLATVSTSLESVIASLPKEERLPEKVVQKVVSLEDMMDRLATRITNSLSTGFREFSEFGRAEKVHVVVSFLAMLELVKQGIIAVEQQSQFGDITMEQQVVNTPHYE